MKKVEQFRVFSKHLLCNAPFLTITGIYKKRCFQPFQPFQRNDKPAGGEKGAKGARILFPGREGGWRGIGGDRYEKIFY